MSDADAEQRRSPRSGERPLPTVRPGKRLDPAAAIDLISTSARLMFANGQTTERMVAAGIAVAAYSTFFAMPWRMLPIPILIGMLAHACR
jgi:hypothetical protein